MNKKNSWVVWFLVALLWNSSAVLIAGTALTRTYASEPQQPGQTLPITAQTQIGSEVIQLEVANTPEQQATGLMFRESLPNNQGMLFPFDPPRITRFWMKNVSINLDMVFLHQGEVKAIAENVPPCTTNPCPVYGPNTLIDQVVELSGGRAKELGLKVGDKMTIDFLEK